MAVIVVGGHTRNIGKTTLTAAIIRALPERRWTAMKITQFGHGVCSANGDPCDCDTGEHTVAVSEERRTQTGTDTSRMLSAGAEKVLWVRTRQGQLAEAMNRVRREISTASDCLIESNSILRFLRPDVYLAVLDPSIEDFKGSASRYLDRADAIFVPFAPGMPRRENFVEGSHASAVFAGARWTDVSLSLLRGKPTFSLDEEGELRHEAKQFIDERLVIHGPEAKYTESSAESQAV